MFRGGANGTTANFTGLSVFLSPLNYSVVEISHTATSLWSMPTVLQTLHPAHGRRSQPLG